FRIIIFTIWTSHSFHLSELIFSYIDYTVVSDIFKRSLLYICKSSNKNTMQISKFALCLLSISIMKFFVLVFQLKCLPLAQLIQQPSLDIPLHCHTKPILQLYYLQ